MSEFGEFFYDGVEIAQVTGFDWSEKTNSESIDIYKNDRNKGKISVGGGSGEFDVSIDSVEANDGMAQSLWEAVRAMKEGNSTAPLVFNLKNKTVTFDECTNAEWGEKGDPSKSLELSLKFSATLVDISWN